MSGPLPPPGLPVAPTGAIGATSSLVIGIGCAQTATGTATKPTTTRHMGTTLRRAKKGAKGIGANSLKAQRKY
jgi:hypothetical protein